MAIDYQKTAKDLVKELGGDGNISNVTHCATRLRFILKDESIVDKEKVAKIKGVITTVQAGGQFQVVIGNHVTDAYKYVMELVTVDDSTSEGTGNKKSGVVSRIIDVISAIFAPFLYTLAACGILQGILGVLVALNAIDTTGGTYRILNFISWTAFTFLPVLIAVTAAKKFKVDTFISLVIACALVCPDYIAMVNAGETVKFLGIKVQLLSYTSSVIPIILAIWIASYVQRFFEKYLPIVIRNLFTPMFTIAIMVPLTLLAFGPIGNTIGGAIGGAFHTVSWSYNMPGIATLPAYFKAGHTTQFIGLLISILVSFVLGAVLTMIVGFEDEPTDDFENLEGNTAIEENNEPTIEFAVPVAGEVFPISKVKDQAFASEAMGKGVGIIPANGEVHAPFDGKIVALYPSGHLVGMSDGKGAEILIHIGVDTVNLNGKGFSIKVKRGDVVKKGDLLIDFDNELLKKEGYDNTVMYIITDTSKNIEVLEGKKEAVKDIAFLTV